MAKKTTTPKKKPEPKPLPNRTLPLVMDDKAQKQLLVAQSITGEKTATKAIIGCMYQAEHFMKAFKEQKERAEALEEILYNSKHAINNYLSAVKLLQQVSEAKPPKPGEKPKTTSRQLAIDDECEYCGETGVPLKNGLCEDCR